METNNSSWCIITAVQVQASSNTSVIWWAEGRYIVKLLCFDWNGKNTGQGELSHQFKGFIMYNAAIITLLFAAILESLIIIVGNIPSLTDQSFSTDQT